jgi:7-cyano-7-deazaguanine reductase
MKRGKLSYEGLQKSVRSLKTPEIEAWRNQYPDKEYIINMDIPEFTCICPKTGLPDFADIKIEYSPDKYCVELKSFKLYTIFYRNLGIFHEHVTNKILEDFVRAVKPRRAKIVAVFNPRGGITTTVTREYKR